MIVTDEDLTRAYEQQRAGLVKLMKLSERYRKLARQIALEGSGSGVRAMIETTPGRETGSLPTVVQPTAVSAS